MWILGLLMLAYSHSAHSGVAMEEIVTVGDMKMTRDTYEYVYETEPDNITFSLPLWDIVQRQDGVWVIPYALDSSLSSAARTAIEEAIEYYETFVCFIFEQSTVDVYMNFVGNGGGCWSYVGRIGNLIGQPAQTISIDDDCASTGMAFHLIMHSLGLFHEHMRPDRAAYIQIFEENILDGFEDYFKIASQLDNIATEYDIASVMHLDSYAFSKNGEPTIRTVAGELIPPPGSISFADREQVLSMYRCICPPETTTPPVTTPPPTTPSPTTPPPTTPPPTTLPPNCFDFSWNCQGRKNHGQCTRRPRIMKRICENTCGFCYCDDIGRRYCRRRRRLCFRRDWVGLMQGRCPLTCGYCGEACQDRYWGCSFFLTDGGGCVGASPLHFVRYCRRTCGFCI